MRKQIGRVSVMRLSKIFIFALLLHPAFISAQDNSSRTSVSEVRTKSLYALRYDLGTNPTIGELLQFPKGIAGWVTVQNFDDSTRTITFRVSAPLETIVDSDNSCEITKQHILKPAEFCSFVFKSGKISVYWAYAPAKTGIRHVVLYIAKPKF